MYTAVNVHKQPPSGAESVRPPPLSGCVINFTIFHINGAPFAAVSCMSCRHTAHTSGARAKDMDTICRKMRRKSIVVHAGGTGFATHERGNARCQVVEAQRRRMLQGDGLLVVRNPRHRGASLPAAVGVVLLVPRGHRSITGFHDIYRAFFRGMFTPLSSESGARPGGTPTLAHPLPTPFPHQPFSFHSPLPFTTSPCAMSNSWAKGSPNNVSSRSLGPKHVLLFIFQAVEHTPRRR